MIYHEKARGSIGSVLWRTHAEDHEACAQEPVESSQPFASGESTRRPPLKVQLVCIHVCLLPLLCHVRRGTNISWPAAHFRAHTHTTQAGLRGEWRNRTRIGPPILVSEPEPLEPLWRT